MINLKKSIQYFFNIFINLLDDEINFKYHKFCVSNTGKLLGAVVRINIWNFAY